MKLFNLLRMKLAVGAAVLAGAFTMMAPAANAVSVAPPPLELVPCATGGATLTGSTYVGCIGPIEGNDTGADSTLLDDLNAGTAFAGYGSATIGSMWKLLGKTDAGGDPVTGDLGDEVYSGDWFASSGLLKNVVVSVKAGECYSAYLFTNNMSASGGGTFDVGLAGLRVGGKDAVGCLGKNVPGISHVSVFTAGDRTPVVPLPAAGWMLIAGLGGLAALRRRKG